MKKIATFYINLWLSIILKSFFLKKLLFITQIINLKKENWGKITTKVLKENYYSLDIFLYFNLKFFFWQIDTNYQLI